MIKKKYNSIVKCISFEVIDGEEVKHLSVVVLPDMETEMLLGMNYLSLGNMEINTDNGYTEFVFEKRD